MPSMYSYAQLYKTEQIRLMQRLKPYTHYSLRGLWIYGPAGSGKDYYVNQIIQRQNLTVY